MPANSQPASNKISLVLWVLLAVLLARLWLIPMSSSFWVDEMVTAFVVNHPGHPSFAIAPQVPESIYYWLPRISQSLFGGSEIAYRVPSFLAMALALFLIGRLASRLIHPDAAWLAIFACLALRWFNYLAIDARPYAVGICVATASLLFLIRWLDHARWPDAALFITFAALLWRVHLIYWPFYLILALYPGIRFWSRDTPVTWLRAATVFALLGLTLLPVALRALSILHGAGAHVIISLPDFRTFQHEIRWSLVASLGGGAWILSRIFRWPRPTPPQSILFIAALWLMQPVCLYTFSHLTGNSVFIDRYLSLGLPGTALAATAAAAFFMPATVWKPAALATACMALLLSINTPTRHDHSDWRAAAQAESRLALDPDTPVICPSPFIEARTPVWHPDYPLPGFLYAHLPFYRVQGKLYLFPFESADGEGYGAQITATLAHSRRFMIYGSDARVSYWRKWFAARPELSAWKNRTLKFGDVWLAVFDP